MRFCFLQGWGRLSLAERHRESGGKPPQSKEGAAVLRPYNRNGDVESPLQRRAELAGGEVFHGAKACVEFASSQAPLALENAEKMRSRHVAFECVAFDTTGNQVAVGIASEAHAWHDVVDASRVRGSAAEAVKADAVFAIVNSFAERQATPEIRGFEGRGRKIGRAHV